MGNGATREVFPSRPRGPTRIAVDGCDSPRAAPRQLQSALWVAERAHRAAVCAARQVRPCGRAGQSQYRGVSDHAIWPLGQAKVEMQALDGRRKELEAQLKAADEPPPLPPGDGPHLPHEGHRARRGPSAARKRLEATEALRGVVTAIVLTPDGSKEGLGIELRGNLADMLRETVQTKRSPETGDLLVQIKLVAGAGFEPATFGL